MVTRRKRGQSVHQEEPSLPEQNAKAIQQQLRNCWEFAALGQFLFIFGGALKIPDNWSVEILESEFLGTAPEKFIPLIKVALLRSVSSHRGLVDEQFEDYTRRQYRAKKPAGNPFGDAEQPIKFADLPVLTKVRILHQLSQWSLIHPERLREKLPDVTDKEQQDWRVEFCGFDSQENTYFLLDDNRLYKRTPMKVPLSTKPTKTLKKSTARPSKRRKITNGQAEENEEEVKDNNPEKVMLESMEWKCVCATIEEYLQLIETWKKSKDHNEKAMRAYLIDDVLPVLQQVEEEKKKEEAARQRQLAIESAVANRKRSSRIDAKLTRQRAEEEKAEEERKRQEEIRAEREAVDRSKRIGRERESRLAARERRITGREGRLSLGRLESEKASGNDSDSTTHGGRQSTRRRELEKRKLASERARAADDWVFDCICGAHGTNFDDGTPQVACDKCEVWQHVACLNLSPGTENKEFICERCLYREKTESLPIRVEQPLAPLSESPKITIKLKLPAAQYQDSPIRVAVPAPKHKPEILPLSPRRSPNTMGGQEEDPQSEGSSLPPQNHIVSDISPTQQLPDLGTPAADDGHRANGGVGALPPLDSNGPPPSTAEMAAKLLSSTQLQTRLPGGQGLGEAEPRDEYVKPNANPIGKSPPPVVSHLDRKQTPLPENTESNGVSQQEVQLELHANQNS